MRHRREDEDLERLVADLDFAVLDGGVGEDVLVYVVEVVVETEERVGKVVEILLDDGADGVAVLRDEVGPDARDRVEHERLRHVAAAGEDVAQARHVVGELRVVLPPGVVVELRGRPVPLPLALDGIVVAVVVEEVDAEDVLPVGHPLHPLQRAVPVGPPHRLTQEPRAAVVVRRRRADLEGDVLGRLRRAPDLRVEVVHPDHVHVPEVAEEVALAAGLEPQQLLEEQVAGEEGAVFVAPVGDPLVVGLLVLLGEGVPEVVADLGGLLAHVRVERREVGLEVVAAPLAEDLEHLAAPRHDVVLHADLEVIHRRLVGVEPRHGLPKLVADGGLVLLVREFQEALGALRVERVDVPRGLFLEEVHQRPLALGRLPRDGVLKREVLVEVDRLLDAVVELLGADAVGRDGLRRAGVDVARVLRFEEREERPVDVERDEVEVALRDVRVRVDHLPLGRPARPVHLVVDPRVDPDLLRLGDGELHALEPRVGEVADLEPHPAVDKDAADALVVVLAELPLHLLLLELAVPKPERDDAHLQGRLAEVLAGKRDAVDDAVLISHVV